MYLTGVVFTCLIVIGTCHKGGDTQINPRPSVRCNLTYTSTQSCQNYARACLNEVNDQIRLYLTAAYTYNSMATYFIRDDVVYRGFAKIFSKMAAKGTKYAQELQDYTVKRGGRVHYKSIPNPTADWGTPLAGLQEALSLERKINTRLLALHQTAQDKNDPHEVLPGQCFHFLTDLGWYQKLFSAQDEHGISLQDFLEAELLPEQVNKVKQLSDWVTVMGRLEEDVLGWTIFDQNLLEGHSA